MAGVIVLGSLAFVLLGFVLLARHVRRRAVGSGLMGPLDEIYRPTAYRSRVEIEIQDERGAPSSDGERG